MNPPVNSDKTEDTPSSKGTARFFVVLALFWSSLYLYVPVMAPFAQQRGASLQTVGWLVSSYGLTQLLLRIPLGIWSDRLRARRPFITYGFLAALAGALGMALVPHPAAMVVFRALTGACASMWIMFTVLYASRFPSHETSKAMGIAVMATSITQLTSTLTGGVLAEWGRWETPFLLAAGLAAAGFWVSRGLQDSPPSGASPTLPDLLQVGKNRHLLVVSLLAAGVQAIIYMTLYGFTPVYAAQLGASRWQLGTINFAASGVTALAGVVAGNRLVPRFGPRPVVLVAFALATMAWLFPTAGSPALLTLWQVVVSTGTGMAFPTLMALSIQTVPETRRATAMGFFQSLYALGMFSGPALAGLLGQALGLPWVFAGAGTLAAAGALAAWWLLEAPAKEVPPAAPAASPSSRSSG